VHGEYLQVGRTCACGTDEVMYLCRDLPSSNGGRQQLFGDQKREARFEANQENSLEIIQRSKGSKKKPHN